MSKRRPSFNFCSASLTDISPLAVRNNIWSPNNEPYFLIKASCWFFNAKLLKSTPCAGVKRDISNFSCWPFFLLLPPPVFVSLKAISLPWLDGTEVVAEVVADTTLWGCKVSISCATSPLPNFLKLSIIFCLLDILLLISPFLSINLFIATAGSGSPTCSPSLSFLPSPCFICLSIDNKVAISLSISSLTFCNFLWFLNFNIFIWSSFVSYPVGP